ncbi:fatty acid--CoA ligase family protein [Sphingobium sp. Sx8-8]|uniref:class I adenylate-forming enzyme family protein n=1 Tax=Sphingobium sp. Sx8-8 TaxID=2933617 RepID=UPI001F58DF59|nr:fatty acid--CoA ligase family protein [Sphingobium sp. Sx8-8]
MPFGTDLKEMLKVDPAAPVIEHDRKWLNWGQLAAMVEAVDRVLDEAGVPPDARVGVLIRNRPWQLAAMLALFSSRRCLMVLNPMLPRAKLLSDLASARMSAVVAEADDFAAEDIVDAVRQGGAAAIRLDPAANMVLPVEGLEKARTDAEARSTGEVTLEMLTSGTTGTPKRIPLGRRAFDKALEGAMVYEKDRTVGEPPRLREGTVLQVAPISHIGGIFSILTALLSGRRIVLFEKFSVQQWRDAVVKHRPRVTSLVPAALRMVLEANLPKEDLSSLVALRSGTAPLDAATVRAFLDRYDLPVLQIYGATEYIGGVAGWTLKDFRRYFHEKPDSCGRIHADVEARIVDPETGAILPPGEVGILELKAAQLGDADRWFRTTDRALIDEDHFMTIVGRADNAIIRGGFKVHPDDVVKMLEQHPSVREAAVVGIADPRLGQVPAAAVILRADAAPVTEEGLIAFARERLSAYQVPTRLLFVPDLPRTSSMKPATDGLRALFEAAPA